MSDPALRVLSFGYGHGYNPPDADITVDVRTWFRDPHVSPELRNLTGLDEAVREAVRTTPGVLSFMFWLYSAARVLLERDIRTVTVAIGCVGGRHRSVVIADMLAHHASTDGWTTEVQHLHVDRPVLHTTRTNHPTKTNGGT
jgi:RNase adaptor protein for sRNA GlmZ degradation